MMSKVEHLKCKFDNVKHEVNVKSMEMDVQVISNRGSFK